MKFADLKATTKLTWTRSGGRKPGTEPKDKLPAKQAAKQQETPGLINNQQAGSTYEWNVARALWALGWQFSYQVPVMGGSRVRGGQVLDFLVHTRPLRTALIVNGDYYHQGDEEYKQTELMSALAREGITVNTEPLVMWAADSSTYDAAYSYLNSKIGRG